MRKLIYKLAYFFAGKSIAKKHNFIYEEIETVNEPFILLCNHNTDADGPFAAIAFHKYHMYFVMSEHTLRRKFTGWLIKLLLNPVARQKGMQDYTMVRHMVKRLSSNENICIFAEGNRSPDGITEHISDSIGKLIKLSGASLVTYRFSGGYFTQPRWARNYRKGRIIGKLIGSYSQDKLKQMSAAEINAIINKDLYTDAYEEQKFSPVEFKGKNLAESIETVLFLCPECEQISSVESSGDTAHCSCGMVFEYTRYGYLKSLNEKVLAFDNVRDWYAWQKKRLSERKDYYKSLPPEQIISFDESQSLKQINKNGRAVKLAFGQLRLYCDRICVYGDTCFSFYFSDIADMQVCDMDKLVFSTLNRESYEIDSSVCKSAYKYIFFYELLK